MSIRFNCPNGHEMNVKDKYAGLTGLCPHCQAQVSVPIPAGKLTEADVVDMLGPPPGPDPDDLPVHQDPRQQSSHTSDQTATSGMSLKGVSPLNRGMKTCPKCKRDVRAAYDICPHCRTYFTDVSEISRRMAASCKQCGAEYAHHEIIIWCKNCGADLRQQS